MRHLIIDNIRKIIIAIAFFETFLAIIMFMALIKSPDPTLIGILLMDAGLIIDAVLMAANSNEKRSRIRFIAHGLLTPLLFPLSADFAGMNAAGGVTKIIYIIIWILTGVMMIGGVWMGVRLNLMPVSIGELNRYSQSRDNIIIFRILSFILTAGLLIPLIISGVFVWITQGNPLIFLAAAVMFGFTAIAPATKNFDLLFVTSMVGELLMTGLMVLFQI